MKRNIESFLSDGAYLPEPLRDFHDQKVNWVDAHCYVIDIFLWFMARRGWTLQRSRSGLEFRDLQDDIKARKERDAESFLAMMKTPKPPLT